MEPVLVCQGCQDLAHGINAAYWRGMQSGSTNAEISNRLTAALERLGKKPFTHYSRFVSSCPETVDEYTIANDTSLEYVTCPWCRAKLEATEPG